MKRIPLVFLLSIFMFPAFLQAEVGDPQIKTDHPYYQGELSCSTFDRVAESSYKLLASLPGGKYPQTDTERLVALWAWRVMHHQHAAENLIYIGEGAHHTGDGYMFCRDGLLGLFSHSTGLCYSIHAQFTPFIQMMTGDWRAASASLIPGHTSFEAFTDGKWRWADMTCGSMFFTDKKGFDALNIQDMKDKGEKWCNEDARRGPLNLYLMPFGDRFFRNAYRESDGKMKFFGYFGMPIQYTLRAGESFTRWSDTAGDDGVEAIWHKDFKVWYNKRKDARHGMARNETFMFYGPPGQNNQGRHRGKGDVPFNHSGKGAFVYTPDLNDPDQYKEALWSEKGSIVSDGWLHASGEGEAVFMHGSPYQIAAHVKGAPDREWKVRTDICDLTAILSGTAKGSVAVSISTDNGQTWDEIGNAQGVFSLDFSEQVKGKFQYLLRVKLSEVNGLKAMNLRTVVQIGPAVFPQLKAGGSTVTFTPGQTGIVYGGPHRRKALLFHDKSLSSGDKNVFRITAPGPIRSVHGVAGATNKNRGPICVETSVDGNKWDVVMKPYTLVPGAKRNMDSSIWGNGYHSFMWGYKRYPQTKSKTGFVRFQNMEALDKALIEIYVTYDRPSRSDVKVSFGWSEGGSRRTASHVFNGTDKNQTWKIGTGGKVKTDWVKFESVSAKGSKKKSSRPSARPASKKVPRSTGDPNEKRAAVFWDMAQDAIKEGNSDMARYSLNQIIKKYPDTSYAGKAKKALTEL